MLACNANGRKDPIWGTLLHAGLQSECHETATQLNGLLVSCGRKAAARPGKGFSCMPSHDHAGTSLFGTVGSAKDCKGLGKFLTKALKKIERKPSIRFVCEAYNSTGFMRVYVKAKRSCTGYVGRINSLMRLYTSGKFVKCTAPKKEPSKVLR